MKWEKLKERILDECTEKPDDANVIEFKRLAKESGTNVLGYLNSYDIHCAPQLRARFKHLFPVYLQTGTLYLNNGNRGWTIDKEFK